MKKYLASIFLLFMMMTGAAFAQVVPTINPNNSILDGNTFSPINTTYVANEWVANPAGTPATVSQTLTDLYGNANTGWQVTSGTSGMPYDIYQGPVSALSQPVTTISLFVQAGTDNYVTVGDNGGDEVWFNITSSASGSFGVGKIQGMNIVGTPEITPISGGATWFWVSVTFQGNSTNVYYTIGGAQANGGMTVAGGTYGIAYAYASTDEINFIDPPYIQAWPPWVGGSGNQYTDIVRNATDPNGTANNAYTVTTDASGGGGNNDWWLDEPSNDMVYTTDPTISIYAKAGTDSYIFLTPKTGARQYFNLSTGTVGSSEGMTVNSATMTSLGNGWYLCSVTYQSMGSSAAYYGFGGAQSDGGSPVASGTYDVYLPAITPGSLPGGSGSAGSLMLLGVGQ